MVLSSSEHKLKLNIFKIILISTVVQINSVEAGLRKNNPSKAATTLKTAIQEFVRSTANHDITLITHDNRQDNCTGIINNAIYDGAAGFLPMYSFTPEDINSATLKPLNKLTSRSLVIHSENDIFGTTIDVIFNDIGLITSGKAMPKIVLVFIHDIQYFVKAKWILENLAQTKIVNFCILEITYKGDEILEDSMTLHEFDFRTDDYTIRPFSTKINNWFPDKVSNLLGHSFYVWVDDNTCYMRPDGQEYCSGSGSYIIENMQELMNATFRLCKTDDCDLSSTDFTIIHNEKYYMMDYTVPLEEDRVCLVIPKIQVKQSESTPWKCLIAVLVGLMIILIFWLISILMKIDRSLRHPINALALLFGQAVTTVPKSLVEKIMFISIIASSTRYTAMFYTEFFNLGLKEDIELNIASIEEFEESRLEAAMPEELYNEGFLDNGEVLKNINTNNIDYFYHAYMNGTLKYDNLSMFLSSRDGIRFCEVLEQLYKKPVVKISNFCILSTHRAHIVPRRLQYVARINDIILRTIEFGYDRRWNHGVISKNNRNYSVTLTSRSMLNNTYFKSAPNSNSYQSHLTLMLLYTYAIAFVVFLGEILLGYLKRLRK